MLGRRLSDEEIERLAIERPIRGAQLEETDDVSSSSSINLSPGMIVFRIDGTPVEVRPYEGRQNQFISFADEGGRIYNTGVFYTNTGTLFEMQNARVVGSRALTQSERASLGIGGGTSAGGGGGGGGGDSSGAALQRLREQIAAEREEGRLEREQQERLTKLQEENAFKRSQLSDISSLTGQIVTATQQARQLLAEMSTTDPLRAATAMQGGLSRGVTPAQQVRGQLTSFANAPAIEGVDTSRLTMDTPTNYLSAIQAALRRRLLPPSPPGATLGLAHGGTASLLPGEGILVGEGKHGEGVKRGTAEVARMLPDGRLEVIPIGDTAQEGGQFNLASLSALAPLYGELGFTGSPPLANRPAGYLPSVRGGYHPLSLTNSLQRLGIRPRLLQIGTGDNYFLADQSGGLRSISAGDLFGPGGGYDPRQAVQFNPQDFGQLGEMLTPLGLSLTGERLSGAQPIIEGGIPSGMTPFGAPLVEPSTGALLPDPIRFGLAQLNELDFATLGLYGQALELSLGLPRGTGVQFAMERSRQGTPVGQFAGQARLA